MSPLYVTRCATIVSLTQLAEQQEQTNPPSSTQALDSRHALREQLAQVSNCAGVAMPSYLYGESRKPSHQGFQKQPSDDAVVPDMDDSVSEGSSDAAADFGVLSATRPSAAFCSTASAMPHSASAEQVNALELFGQVPQKSILDSAMLSAWDACGDVGLFRYDVTACATRVLPGKHGFVAQLNEGRANLKRPTEFRIDQVVQPFDASKFNFKKAQLREVLLAFEPSADGRPRLQPAVPASSSPNLVFINVSPIEYGHVLLVPRVLDDLAQLVDASTMRLALRFAREAANPFFRVGYNSLGAYATINHLHFQAYYLHTQLACEGAATAPLAFTAAVNKDAIPSELPENTLEWWSSATDMDNDSSEGLVKVSQLADFPVRGWVLETTEAAGSGGLLQLADTVAAACIQMQGMNQPHNLIITDCGTRVFLWPQCFAEKQALGLVPEHLLETGVNPATFEVSGHMVLKRRADYESMTEADAVELLAQVSLNEQRFDALSAELFAQRPWS